MQNIQYSFVRFITNIIINNKIYFILDTKIVQYLHIRSSIFLFSVVYETHSRLKIVTVTDIVVVVCVGLIFIFLLSLSN